MSYGGKYDTRHELQSEGSWRLRDVVFLLGTLGAAGTLATVVIGGTIIGGGALLLLGLPLFLLFSPILVPGGIIATIIGGGLLFALVSTAAAIGAVSWLWNYFRGKHPIGADSVDYVTGRAKGVVDYGREKTGEILGYGQHKASEMLGYGQQRTADTLGYGGQKAHDAGSYAQQQARAGQEALTGKAA